MDTVIASIISHALPGLRVTGAQQLGTRTQLLSLSDGRRVVLRLGGICTVEAALRKLKGEIDLPVPELLASDVAGDVVGQPWLLRSYLEGTPLPAALATLDEQGLYSLGRRLGEIVARVHNLACERYGVLVGSDPHATTRDDLAYLALRAEAAIARLEHMTAFPVDDDDSAAHDAGSAAANAMLLESLVNAEPLLPAHLAAELRTWFAQQSEPTGRKAALVHGDLRPEHILLRQQRAASSHARLQISGILGWERALGWAPGWDHVRLLDAVGDMSYFSLRVGYAESYEELTQRPSEQVREYALLPYRLIMHLEDLASVQDATAQQRHLRILAGLLRLSAKIREGPDDDR